MVYDTAVYGWDKGLSVFSICMKRSSFKCIFDLNEKILF